MKINKNYLLLFLTLIITGTVNFKSNKDVKYSRLSYQALLLPTSVIEQENFINRNKYWISSPAAK